MLHKVQPLFPTKNLLPLLQQQSHTKFSTTNFSSAILENICVWCMRATYITFGEAKPNCILIVGYRFLCVNFIYLSFGNSNQFGMENSLFNLNFSLISMYNFIFFKNENIKKATTIILNRKFYQQLCYIFRGKQKGMGLMGEFKCVYWRYFVSILKSFCQKNLKINDVSTRILNEFLTISYLNFLIV